MTYFPTIDNKNKIIIIDNNNNNKYKLVFEHK